MAASSGPFTLPTSVITTSGRHPPEVRTSPITRAAAWTGVATTTRSASASTPPTVRAPSSTARSATPSPVSTPLTCQRRSRRARPTDPPMSPVPKIMARGVTRSPGPSAGAGSGPRPSVGEVVTESLGALEVDMMDLFPGAVRGDMQQDPDAVLHRPDDSQLAGTDQRHGAQAHRPGRGGREQRADVLGGGEQDGDEVVLDQPVALQDQPEQVHHPFGDGLGGVGVDGGGAAHCSDGGGHPPGMLLRPVAGPNRPILGGEGG